MAAVCVNVLILTSTSSNGAVYGAYIAGSSVYPVLSAFASETYYQSGNSYTNYRFVLPYNYFTENWYNNATYPTGSNIPTFWLNFINFPVSTAIASVQVWVNMDF